jgi:hypothetical protein
MKEQYWFVTEVILQIFLVNVSSALMLWPSHDTLIESIQETSAICNGRLVVWNILYCFLIISSMEHSINSSNFVGLLTSNRKCFPWEDTSFIVFFSMAVISVYTMSCLTSISHTGCPCNCSWMRGRHSFVQLQAWAFQIQPVISGYIGIWRSDGKGWNGTLS